MDLKVTFANGESRYIRNIPEGAPMKVTSAGHLKLSAPGVYSGNHDIATFNNVIAYFVCSWGPDDGTGIQVENAEKAKKDFVDGGNEVPVGTGNPFLF